MTTSTSYNSAWTVYKARGESQSFYVNKDLATLRALSHLMADRDDYDRDHYEWRDIGDSMGYWIHTDTGYMFWVEAIRIYTGD